MSDVPSLRVEATFPLPGHPYENPETAVHLAVFDHGMARPRKDLIASFDLVLEDPGKTYIAYIASLAEHIASPAVWLGAEGQECAGPVHQLSTSVIASGVASLLLHDEVERLSQAERRYINTRNPQPKKGAYPDGPLEQRRMHYRGGLPGEYDTSQQARALFHHLAVAIDRRIVGDMDMDAQPNTSLQSILRPLLCRGIVTDQLDIEREVYRVAVGKLRLSQAAALLRVMRGIVI